MSRDGSLIGAFAGRLHILGLLSYYWAPFGVSKLEGLSHGLVCVCACQGATLLEITCRGSYRSSRFILLTHTCTEDFRYLHVSPSIYGNPTASKYSREPSQNKQNSNCNI